MMIRVISYFAFCFVLTAWLASCSSQKVQQLPPDQDGAPAEKMPSVVPHETVREQRLSQLLSPYSSDGLITLNQYRTSNSKLNDFLLRNRKPDYFFGGIDGEFQFQKIYLIYLQSQNLYLFDPSLADPYKKFHPLPASIQKRLAELQPEKPQLANSLPPANSASESARAQENRPDNYPSDIEKSLAIRQPQPYLSAQLLAAIPTGKNPDGSVPFYPDLYFLDKPLEELLENQYSAKYDSQKHNLKIIFPQAYEAGTLYQNSKMETRKILVTHDTASGRELSLVVPDFLPGSAFYQATKGNMAKAFASLYQVNLPQNLTSHKSLRMRYQLKLCQRDGRELCAARSGNVTTVRAIVIAATLYDSASLKPIETFVLK